MKMDFKPYTAPAGGWGSVGSLARRFAREGNPVSAGLTLMYQNNRTVTPVQAAPGRNRRHRTCLSSARTAPRRRSGN